MDEVSVTLDATPPEEGPNSTLEPPEVPTPEVATKKPRKPRTPRPPRPPKLASNLAKVIETSPAQEAPKEPLPLEFWAGLMQTQKVLMARRKSDRYESFRIV